MADALPLPLVTSVERFPATPELKAASGVPWGVTITPFVQHADFEASAAIAADSFDASTSRTERERKLSSVSASSVSRCAECFGYINSWCRCHGLRWQCALCGYTNYDTLPAEVDPESDYDAYFLRKRSGAAAHRFIEFEQQRRQLVPTIHTLSQPELVVMGVVDLACSPAQLGVVVEALTAAVSAMHESTCFGLVVFSSRVGLYDLSCERPHVMHIPCLNDGDDPAGRVQLDDLLPDGRLAFPLALCRQQALAAVASLSPVEGVERCFGSAVSAVVHALGRQFDAECLGGARLLSFLGGRPNCGVGAAPSDADGDVGASRGVYKGIAEVGAPRGVCVDLVCVASVHDAAPAAPPPRAAGSPAAGAAAPGAPFTTIAVSPPPAPRHTGEVPHFGLASMGVLAAATAGCTAVWRVETPADRERVVGDVVARATAAWHAQCMLRVRCTSQLRLATDPGSELESAEWYGPGAADADVPDLLHLAGATPATTVSALLQFEDVAGLTADAPPLLQLATVYTSFQESEDDGGAGYIVRRVCVFTMEAPVAANLPRMYQHVDQHVVMALLMHQAFSVADAAGGSGAAAVAPIRDWLVRFLNVYCSLGFHSALPGVIDVDVSTHPHLRLLTQRLYGLLLAVSEYTAANDAAVECRLRLTSTPPRFATLAFYPHASAYASPSTPLHDRLRLTHTAVAASDASIVLVHAFGRVVVALLGRSVASNLASEPSPLTAAVEQASAFERHCGLPGPAVEFVPAGTRLDSALSGLLVEDCPVTAAGVEFRNFSEFEADVSKRAGAGDV